LLSYLAQLGRDVPHILLLDEPTNHLDMVRCGRMGIGQRRFQTRTSNTHGRSIVLDILQESIDALAKAVNEFQGGLVLVSHDMRLIGQVAKEIWICDNKTIAIHRGDIQSFKMDMRAAMGIDQESSTSNKLRGDASVSQKKIEETSTAAPSKALPSKRNIPKVERPPDHYHDDVTVATVSSVTTSATNLSLESSLNGTDTGGAAPKRYIPPHLRKKMAEAEANT
jgi:ATP-binding cassette subfamily F protein 2